MQHKVKEATLDVIAHFFLFGLAMYSQKSARRRSAANSLGVGASLGGRSTGGADLGLGCSP